MPFLYDPSTGAVRVNVVGTSAAPALSVMDSTGALNAVIVGGAKVVLTEDKTFYVRSDGSNANSGLVDSAEGAWQTLQYAYEWVAENIDQNGYAVTIWITLPGTYEGIFSVTRRCVTGPVNVRGDEADETGVVIVPTTGHGSGPSTTCFFMWGLGPLAQIFVRDVTCSLAADCWAIQASYNNYAAMGTSVNGAGTYDFTGKMKIISSGGAPAAFFYAGFGGWTEIFGDWTVDLSGGTGHVGNLFYLEVQAYGSFLPTTFVVTTITFDYPLFAITHLCMLYYAPDAMTGTYIGTKYSVTTNSVYDETGTTVGSVAGITSTGGQVV